MPELIEKGYLYIAQPPLYKVTSGGKELYMKNDEEFEQFIMQRSMEKIKCFIRDREVGRERLKEDIESIRGIERYLGEMERLGIEKALFYLSLGQIYIEEKTSRTGTSSSP